jgi:hypothetical protein
MTSNLNIAFLKLILSLTEFTEKPDLQANWAAGHRENN